MAEVNPPLWEQNPDYPAAVDRQLFSALTDGPGVAREDDLQVSAGSGLAVDVTAGHAFVDGTEVAGQGRYLVANDDTVTVPLDAADASNPRNDLIVARVQDAFYSGATSAWSIEAVAGTPGSSPSDPTVPANSLVLARVRVPAGAGSVDPGNITDRRTLAPYKAGSPIGTVVDYAGASPPAGWLPCDGSTVSRTLYAGLFSVVGTTYGTGDGSTTFGLPDLQGRFRIGTGTRGSDTYSRGGTGGAATVTLSAGQMPAHTHTGTTGGAGSHNHGGDTFSSGSAHTHNAGGSLVADSGGGHTHSVEVEDSGSSHSHDGSGFRVASSPSGSGATYLMGATATGGAHGHTVSGTTGSSGSGHTHAMPSEGSHVHTISSAGGGSSHENRPPYLALVPIIRAA